MPVMGSDATRYDLQDPKVVAAIDDVPFWSAPFGLKLLDVVELRQQMRVLDIGSGTGFPVIELAQRLGASSEVVGLDPWPAALERARAKSAIWNLGNLTLLEGKAEALPFPADHFDLIVSNNGVNNVEDEERSFAEIVRVAKPGAQVVLTMNLPETMHELYDVYRTVLRERRMEHEIERLAAHIHAKRKPLSFIRERLVRHRLEISALHEELFSLRFVDGTALLESALIQIGFLPAWREVLEASDRSPVFAEIERRLNSVAEQHGELRLSVPWICIDARVRKPVSADR